MATVEEHLATFRANEATASRLVEIREYGWAVTCLFYAALHLVEAQLSLHSSGAISSHYDRSAVMRRDSSVRPILRFYTRLKHESENHRYRCQIFDAAEVNRVRTFFYEPLARHMRNLLGVN